MATQENPNRFDKRLLGLDICGVVASLVAIIIPLGWWSGVLTLIAASIFAFAKRIAIVFSWDSSTTTHVRWFSGFFFFAGIFALASNVITGEQKSSVAHLSDISGKLDAANDQLVEIEKDVERVKQETSDDPRKELANMGISWSREAFREALQNQDLRTLALFLDGGMRFSRYEFQLFVVDAEYAEIDAFRFSQEVADLVQSGEQIDPDACGFGARGAFLENALEQPGRRDFLLRVCTGEQQERDVQRSIGIAAG